MINPEYERIVENIMRECDMVRQAYTNTPEHYRSMMIMELRQKVRDVFQKSAITFDIREGRCP